MAFASALQRFLVASVLTLVFFAVVTPIGLVLRALGRDALRLRRNGAQQSYWVERKPPGPEPASLRDTA